LDFTADESVLGKPIAGDLREGKVTLPIIYLLQRADGYAAELIRRVVDERTVTPEVWREISRLLVEHHAIESAYAKAVEYARAARQHLDVFPASSERAALAALTDYVLTRDR
jgi:octaprenyl-diphosphate synthase